MDRRHAKIAISIPAHLLERLERLRGQEEGTSRSRMISDAVEQYVVGAEREALDQQVREAYERMPETDEELAEIDWRFKRIAEIWAEELPWDGPVPKREGE